MIGLNNAVSIAAGENFSVALKSDGTVWTWGSGSNGSLGNGATANKTSPVQVSGIKNAIAVAAGVGHGVALIADSTVWTWGLNVVGQLGDGSTTNRTTPIQVSGLNDIVSVSSRYFHNLALKNDGTVWGWGSNSYGCLGDGTATNRTAPVQVSGLSNITAVAAGNGHSLALKADGRVWAWGNSSHGELGNGPSLRSDTPVQTSVLTNITAISAGESHNLALKNDGTVWAWGYNNYGQIGDGSTANRNIPVQLSGFGSVSKIATGNFHSLAVKNDASVWAWGYNNYGQVDPGNAGSNYGIPTVVIAPETQDYEYSLRYYYGKESTPFTSVKKAGILGQSIPKTDELTYTGNILDGYGRTGTTRDGSAKVISSNPAQNIVHIELPAHKYTYTIHYYKDKITDTGDRDHYLSTASSEDVAGAVIAVIPGAFHPGAGYKPDGIVSGAKIVSSDETKNVAYVLYVKEDHAPPSEVFSQISAGYSHTLAVKDDGTVWAWGDNQSSQCGNGETGRISEMTQVIGLTNVIQVAAGDGFSLALKRDGTVWAWGMYDCYSYGYGSWEWHEPTPIQISSLTDITAISAGRYHAMALDSNGAVWVWGDVWKYWFLNYDWISNPVQTYFPNDNDIVDISAGTNSFLALDRDGTVWEWGQCTYGFSWSPGPMSDLSGAVAISAGENHNLALLDDGTVWAWGENYYGQLGDGSRSSRSTPVQVHDLSDISDISAGENHNLAIGSDGTVWAWGYNNYGQIGDGTTTNRLIPVRILTDAIRISAGNQYSFALISNGTLMGWGANYSGQVDPRNVGTNYLVPTAVFTPETQGYKYTLNYYYDGEENPFDSVEKTGALGQSIPSMDELTYTGNISDG